MIHSAKSIFPTTLIQGEFVVFEIPPVQQVENDMKYPETDEKRSSAMA